MKPVDILTPLAHHIVDVHPAVMFDSADNIMVDCDNTTYVIVRSIGGLWMTMREVMPKLLNWLDQKLVKMVIFPCYVSINSCVRVNEVWRITKQSNIAQINALVLVLEMVVAAVVVISHGDKMFLILVMIACGQIQDDS